MSRQPFFPLFLGDLLTATTRWNGEERALYVLLLAYQWFDGPLPKDPASIALTVQYRLDRFIELWARVRTKYVETDEGLINLRLEEIRGRARAISAARAQAGLKGGQSTQARARANAEQTTKQTSGNTEANDEAKPTSLPGHPIQSNPIQSDPNQIQNTDSARAPEQSESVKRLQINDDQRRERWQRCKDRYPAFANRQDWIPAEKAASKLVDNGLATWDQLEAACQRYADYCTATRKTGTQYVMRPGLFFTAEDQPWSQDWTPPQDAPPVEDRNQRELQKFLKGGS